MEVVAVSSSMQNQSGAASGSGYGSNGACVCNCTGAQVQGMDICECNTRRKQTYSLQALNFFLFLFFCVKLYVNLLFRLGEKRVVCLKVITTD